MDAADENWRYSHPVEQAFISSASARDLVMHHGCGAAIQRATRDVDIAIQVGDWSAFDTMCDNLTKEGYSKTDASHQLMSSEGVPLDIIPFGPIENELSGQHLGSANKKGPALSRKSS